VGRLGRIVAKVPHSIVVGFTIGIAITIALSQIGEVLGLTAKMGYGFFDKLSVIAANFGAINIFAVVLGLGTFLITKYVLKVSVFIPAPLLAIGVTTVVAATVWADKGFTLVKDRYGAIPTDFWVFTPPAALSVTPEFLMDLAYFVVAIVFVAAIESLLCSRMADRLADNQGLPYNPNKELWGQGLVQVVCPLLNGFPHTGALARTATNIKLGAISPLAGIFKCFLKLGMAAFLASYLELVPMACIGGILLYVASAMVKPAEVKQVFAHNNFHVGLMVYTAVMVVLTSLPACSARSSSTACCIASWISRLPSRAKRRLKADLRQLGALSRAGIQPHYGRARARPGRWRPYRLRGHAQRHVRPRAVRFRARAASAKPAA
jgi:MFS superfamily sulfate permease-like transporter